MRSVIRAIALVAGLTQLGPVARAADDRKIGRAIEKGVAYLKGLHSAGLWEFSGVAFESPPNEATYGATALAGLTLLECDVDAKDEAIQKAAAAIRPHTAKMTYTYTLSLAIMFLDRLGESGDDVLIESMTVRLLAGQNKTGGWGYTCPAVDAAEMKRLTHHVEERNELVSKGRLPKTGERKRRTAADLPREIIDQVEEIKRRGPTAEGPGDNSNSQLATLALWVARRHGMPVDDALARNEQGFRVSQSPRGGWAYYRPSDREEARAKPTTPTGTCAGLLGLAVGTGIFNEKMLGKKAQGKPARDPRHDEAIVAGLASLGTSMGDSARGRQGFPGSGPKAGDEYYYLWSLERTAMIYGLKTIGNKDWYKWGTQFLLAKQEPRGGWRGNYAAGGVDTCFALLFLRRSNLADDLTANLKGRRRGGENALKTGGVGGGKLVGDSDTGKKPENKIGAGTIDRPKAGGDADSQVAEIARLSAGLACATPDKQDDLIKDLEAGKGVKYTEALAAAIPSLRGETKDKARQALLQRMTRMSTATLADKLTDDSLEIRCAAAGACLKKKAKALTPQLIPLLEDPEPVADAAHRALQCLTGKDFGPAPDATRAERKEAVSKWKSWWQEQKKE